MEGVQQSTKFIRMEAVNSRELYIGHKSVNVKGNNAVPTCIHLLVHRNRFIMYFTIDQIGHICLQNKFLSNLFFPS